MNERKLDDLVTENRRLDFENRRLHSENIAVWTALRLKGLLDDDDICRAREFAAIAEHAAQRRADVVPV